MAGIDVSSILPMGIEEGGYFETMRNSGTSVSGNARLMAQPNYPKRVWILLGSVLLFRLIYAAVFPVSPAGDEAYYWDWGRQLDYGYYSKPPFIAWLYAFVDWVGNGSLFAIRATAAILGTGSVLILFFLASSLFDQRVGWMAAIAAIAAPANSVLSFFLTIDAPLVFCWSVALWMLWRYLSGEGKGGTLFTLFCALSIGHLSKQMMMVFPFLAILLLVLHRDSRHFLRRPALWITLFGSFVALAPPLLWNSRNGWITFKHTSHHFQSTADDGNLVLERLEDFLSFVGSQLGALSPVIGLTLFCVSLFGLKSVRSAPLSIRLLLVFGALPLAGMLVLALRQGLQPNWPAVFYVSCFALAGAFYAGRELFGFPPQGWRRAFRLGVVIGVALSAYFYFGPLLFQAVGKQGHKADPNRRLLGYGETATQFQRVRETFPDAEELFLVTMAHRHTTSLLAFSLPDQPRVYRWESYDMIRSQYELWNNPFEDGFAGKDGLILVPGSDALPSQLAESFESYEKVGEFDVEYRYDNVRHFSVFRGEKLKQWPKGVPLPEQ